MQGHRGCRGTVPPASRRLKRRPMVAARSAGAGPPRRRGQPRFRSCRRRERRVGADRSGASTGTPRLPGHRAGGEGPLLPAIAGVEAAQAQAHGDCPQRRRRPTAAAMAEGSRASAPAGVGTAESAQTAAARAPGHCGCQATAPAARARSCPRSPALRPPLRGCWPPAALTLAFCEPAEGESTNQASPESNRFPRISPMRREER